MKNKIKLRTLYYYNYIKIKKIDNYIIITGVLGIIIGILSSIMIINQVFAWLVLIGLCIKLYDFSEKIERELVPYDYNKLLTAPNKKQI